MFWALEICWKYWLIRIKLDVINSLRHMKAEIQPFRRLNLTVSMWLEAFSIIIELSHKILWEEFRIKTNHKGRLRIAAFQSYNSKDYDLTFSLTIDTFRSTGWNQIDSGLRSSRIPYCRKSSHIPKRWRIIRLVLTCWCPTLCQRVSFWPGGWFSFDNLLVSLSW